MADQKKGLDGVASLKPTFQDSCIDQLTSAMAGAFPDQTYNNTPKDNALLQQEAKTLLIMCPPPPPGGPGS